MIVRTWHKVGLIVVVPLIVLGVRWAAQNARLQSDTYTVTLVSEPASYFKVVNRAGIVGGSIP